MKSGSSYAFTRTRFLTIICFIGIYGAETLLNPTAVKAGTHAEIAKKRWQPLPAQKDILLLRNQPHHVIEGTGAAGMLLGETETELRQHYGEPAYRDYASPETLHYTEKNFSASYLLRNGRIVEIWLEVEKRKTPSFEWFTALGLHERDVNGQGAARASETVKRFYRTARVRQIGDLVEVLSRGIRLRFRGQSLIRLEVVAPQAYEAE